MGKPNANDMDGLRSAVNGWQYPNGVDELPQSQFDDTWPPPPHNEGSRETLEIARSNRNSTRRSVHMEGHSNDSDSRFAASQNALYDTITGLRSFLDYPPTSWAAIFEPDMKGLDAATESKIDWSKVNTPAEANRLVSFSAEYLTPRKTKARACEKQDEKAQHSGRKVRRAGFLQKARVMDIDEASLAAKKRGKTKLRAAGMKAAFDSVQEDAPPAEENEMSDNDAEATGAAGEPPLTRHATQE
jgi:hypothetical protein